MFNNWLQYRVGKETIIFAAKQKTVEDFTNYGTNKSI